MEFPGLPLPWFQRALFFWFLPENQPKALKTFFRRKTIQRGITSLRIQPPLISTDRSQFQLMFGADWHNVLHSELLTLKQKIRAQYLAHIIGENSSDV